MERLCEFLMLQSFDLITALTYVLLYLIVYLSLYVSHRNLNEFPLLDFPLFPF